MPIGSYQMLGGIEYNGFLQVRTSLHCRTMAKLLSITPVFLLHCRTMAKLRQHACRVFFCWRFSYGGNFVNVFHFLFLVGLLFKKFFDDHVMMDEICQLLLAFVTL